MHLLRSSRLNESFIETKGERHQYLFSFPSTAHLNRELHVIPLTWRRSSVLAVFQMLNTVPLSFLYKLGTQSMEKVSFVLILKSLGSEKMDLMFSKKEELHCLQMGLGYTFQYCNTELNRVYSACMALTCRTSQRLKSTIKICYGQCQCTDRGQRLLVFSKGTKGP